ncbi:hypothetical protein GYMLUDRAFT_412161 [Collybiopsis luxurians FD-317 M1]|nr:hypothetical protein GYMLUDRAFT_412161 [Collybiopsis luxurians FD-317 M1]
MSHSNLDHILCSNCLSKISGLVASSGIDDTDYQNLLQRSRSNGIPVTAQDCEEMQVLTDEAIRDLERYDRAISELEAGLDRLKKLRDDTARKRIGLRKFLHSPIRKLPPEILTEVFDNVAGPIIFTGEPRIAATGPGAYCSKLLSPIFPLAWACSWWRALAISESQLWSSFELQCDEASSITHRTPGIIKFIHECFQVRAGTTPRTVSIKEQFSTNIQEHVAPALDVLFESTQQWRDVSLELGSGDSPIVEYMGQMLRVSSKSQWPLLESFTLVYHSPEEILYKCELYHGPLQCPRLRRLEVPHLFGSSPIDLKHLTVLKLAEFFGPSLSVLLVRCPSLHELEVDEFTQNFYPQSQVYRHAYLSHLTILMDGAKFADMWEGLELPALTHLKIDLDLAEDRLPALASMLTRSRCTLQRLSVHCDRSLFIKEKWDIFCSEISSVLVQDAVIDINLEDR